MKDKPSIKISSLGVSIVISSYSKNIKGLTRCIQNIRMQDYPQELVQIVVGFGGLVSETLELKKKYRVDFHYIPKNKQNAEYNRGIAFKYAKNGLVLIMDDDNLLPDKGILMEMVNPFRSHPDLLAVESCYYYYNPKMNLLDRYFSLFGVLDPIAYYLGKADRMRQDSKVWNLLGKATDKGGYFLVEFEKNPSKVSTIGSNGCIVNKKFLLESSDVRPEYFYHTDVLIDAILNGHNKMAFTKNSVAHYTGVRGLWNFLKKRYDYMVRFSLHENDRRRFRVFMQGDEWKLIKSMLICLTFIVPIAESLRGYMKIKDSAWFIHPIMCFGVTLMYGFATVFNFLKSK
jgi:glycosyltransferase involved in cell wall biosynthesis